MVIALLQGAAAGPIPPGQAETATAALGHPVLFVAPTSD